MSLTKSRGKTKRTGSGARYIPFRKTKAHELANPSTLTKLGALKLKLDRGRGAIMKRRLLDTNKVNLYNPKTKKYSVEGIETVLENPANRQFVRSNILSKGTVIQTSKGRAKITSRPAQDGVLNAVLME